MEICATSLVEGLSVKRSSAKPHAAMATPQPRSSSNSAIGLRKTAAATVDITIATPPNTAVGRWCHLSVFGCSTSPRRRAAKRHAGVSTKEIPSARKNETAVFIEWSGELYQTTRRPAS